jgi:hypothetical protein
VRRKREEEEEEEEESTPLIGILYYSGQSRQECCESE